MAGFSEIVGHEQIINYLKNAIEYDKVGHAYILNGPDGAGKMMLAEAFAMALQCENPESFGCEECHSCKQAINHNQPDIIYVTHEKPTVISVDDIREQVNKDIVIKPYSSRYKIYIIDEAQKMNPSAQNAILKTMEEPPAYGILLLLTNNVDGFLQTIRSRCITLNLRSASADVIQEHLMKKYHIPDYQAKVCASFSQGNVGKAIQLASSEEFAQTKRMVLSMLKKMEDQDLSDLSQVAKGMVEYKNDIEEYLDLITIWFKDVLYYKATEDTENLVFQDEIFDIKKQAQRRSYKGIDEILKTLETTRVRLKANVNFELVIELLLMSIKEN